jgi:uncharacterized membrane protein
MNVNQIRQALREEQSDSITRKRKIALLSALGVLDFSIISLYQLGYIRSLPDLPGKVFDSDYVNASEDAYMMGMPDGPLGLGLYALNLVFASAGGTEHTGRPKIFDFLLAGSIAASAGGAVHYLFNMITKQKKACVYCIAGAALNFAMIPLIYPEIRRHLKGETSTD